MTRSTDFTMIPWPVPRRSVFAMDGWFVWCGSMIRSDDGTCHLYYMGNHGNGWTQEKSGGGVPPLLGVWHK